MFRKITDFDGDGKSDFVVIRNQNNQMMWYVWQSSQGFKAFPWGLWTDTPVVGDYDGDGKTDFAVMRKVADIDTFSLVFNYYIFQSSNNTFTRKFFNTSFISDTSYYDVHQDYDGDGKTDVAVLKSTLNFVPLLNVVNSSNNILNSFTLPTNHISLRLGDLSGDGHSDSTSVNNFNPSSGVNITNLVNNNSQTVQFGGGNDYYVPADFDGDGVGDLVVWRNSEGNWYWLRSSDGTFRGVHWGQAGDIPVPADYDGDGITDFAIWRSGTYWIYQSRDGIKNFQWGLSTDQPINY